jgi:dolichol-phosphate mannosyltransferase
VASRRSLLIGGAGFVGANLARRLRAEGHEVVVTGRASERPWRLTGLDDVAYVQVDVTDCASVLQAVRRASPDWVFSLAAYGVDQSQAQTRLAHDVNATGTLNVLQAVVDVGVEAMVHAGSSSEYGAKDHPAAESEELRPNSAYAATKAAGTMLCVWAGESGQVPVTVLRLYTVYGPYEAPTKLVPTLIAHAVRGEVPPLVAPDTPRDFVYVEDACEAFVRAAARGRPGQVLNVASGRRETVADAVDAVRSLFPAVAEPRWGSLAPRSWDTPVWRGACDRIAEELDWRASVPLQEGVRHTAHWLSERPEFWPLYDVHAWEPTPRRSPPLHGV